MFPVFFLLLLMSGQIGHLSSCWQISLEFGNSKQCSTPVWVAWGFHIFLRWQNREKGKTSLEASYTCIILDCFSYTRCVPCKEGARLMTFKVLLQTIVWKRQKQTSGCPGTEKIINTQPKKIHCFGQENGISIFSEQSSFKLRNLKCTLIYSYLWPDSKPWGSQN